MTSHLTIFGYLVRHDNSIDPGHSRIDGRSLFNSLKQPPVFVLWHVSPPLPVPGKLPACTPFHQEPQEMSLRERWSLIKNKWMGCPRDRVNEEWELEAELELVPQSGRQGREEPWGGMGKQSFKFDHYCVFLYSDESGKPEPCATRGSLETRIATKSNWRII